MRNSAVPQSAQRLYNLAVAQQTAGNGPAAIESYQRCIALAASIPEAHNNLGVLLQQRRELDEAISCFRRALALEPDYVRALTNLGYALTESGRSLEALEPLRKAVSLSPRHPPALVNLGLALVASGKPQEALERFREAITVAPTAAEAHFALARLLLEAGQARAAAASCQAAIACRRDLIEAYELLARCLVRCGDLDGAAATYERAVAANPAHPRITSLRAAELLHRGHARQTELRLPEALAQYDEALTLAPNELEARGGALTCHLLACDWGRTAIELGRLRQLPGGIESVPPLVLIGVSDDPLEQLRAGATLGRAAIPAWGTLPPPVSRDHKRIRIAYVSRDFFHHATALLIAELLELHDRERFEVLGVSYGPDDQSPLRTRVLDALDDVLNANGRTDLEAAQWLREREVDIAIDLKGHTRAARTQILAYRPAPIQVNYLGYPGSMAADYIDYIIADEFIIPPEAQAWHREKVVYLPDSYQVNDRRRAIAEIPPTRAQVGLPEEGFVFCCFNNSWKITEPVFDVWMRLLARVPASVLWLLEDNVWAVANLRGAAADRGIAPERLVFSPRVESADHLARHRLADLFLDTLPVNAHTTASDALWAGLPVLTCAGRSFPARVAGSVLRAAGLESLVTHSLEEYEQRAVKLASDPETLRTLRARLASQRESLPLFDTPRFCRHLEAAYEQMWARHRRGEPPTSFKVERSPGGPGDEPAEVAVGELERRKRR